MLQEAHIARFYPVGVKVRRRLNALPSRLGFRDRRRARIRWMNSECVYAFCRAFMLQFPRLPDPPHIRPCRTLHEHEGLQRPSRTLRIIPEGWKNDGKMLGSAHRQVSVPLCLYSDSFTAGQE